MPRNARCVLPGIPYHVTQRGTNRQILFHSAADRRTYLSLIRENLEEVGVLAQRARLAEPVFLLPA
jgi:putative transposase